MPHDLAEPAQRARHPPAAVDEQRPEQAHRVRAARVADGLDLGVGRGIERGADRDPRRVVDARPERPRAEDRLGVGAHEHADARTAEPRAEEQLQGSERAGGQDDLVGGEDPAARLRLPAAVGAAADAQRLRLRTDHGAELLGAPEVVPVERVLRFVAAADHAAAAAHALVEVDGHDRRAERVLRTHAARHLAHDLVGGGGERNRRRAEHSACGLVPRRELAPPVADPRPLRILEERVERLVEHVRVDERAAADAGAGEDERAAQRGQALDPVQAEPRCEDEPPQVPARPREVVGAEAAPGLQDAHAVALLGGAQGGHAPAEARADDDHVDIHGASLGRSYPA